MPARSSREKVVLVTGAAGLLGSALVPRLRACLPAAKIIATDRGEFAPSWSAHDDDIHLAHGDLREAATWEQLPDGVTQIMHLAACIDPDPPNAGEATLIDRNLTPLAHLLDRRTAWPRLRQIVYASSVSVHGPTDQLLTESSPVAPNTLYAATKLAGEHLLAPLRDRNIHVACLRFTSLYGPAMRRHTVVPKMVDAAMSTGEIAVFGSGGRVQDFLHVSDAAEAALLAVQHEADGIFLIGSGRSITMSELAETVAERVTGGTARIRYRMSESEGLPGWRVDISKARQTLGFQPQVDLAAGLEQFAAPVGA
jgi:UDP-glucose 4-epimerase